MVCTRSSSSKNDDGEAADGIPPVQTRGRALSSKRATTRGSRRTSVTDEKIGDNQEPDTSTLDSRASSEPDSQGDIGPYLDISLIENVVFEHYFSLQKSISAENVTAEATSTEPSVRTPSRRRRGSSSSQTPQPMSPSRITRAMRKAGISTPKDVVELEIVHEEQLVVEKEQILSDKKEESRNFLMKSPEAKILSPSNKDVDEVESNELASLRKEVQELLSKVCASEETTSVQNQIERRVVSSGKRFSVETSSEIIVTGKQLSNSFSEKSAEQLLAPTHVSLSDTEHSERKSSMSPHKSPLKDASVDVVAYQGQDVKERSEMPSKKDEKNVAEEKKSVKSPTKMTATKNLEQGLQQSRREFAVVEDTMRSPTSKRTSFSDSIPTPVLDTLSKVVDSVESMVLEKASGKLPADTMPTEKSPPAAFVKSPTFQEMSEESASAPVSAAGEPKVKRQGKKDAAKSVRLYFQSGIL
ncbi:unnamed protein product [Strongylus vulgaris]|uniref:Uncharacterized protein n=1 Tax=Strongylus vulgaris TaxID=40348 RepID=A0A3P7IVH5_STRVU|nr:unnamed protein product [Strongylus vulgaris]